MARTLHLYDPGRRRFVGVFAQVVVQQTPARTYFEYTRVVPLQTWYEYFVAKGITDHL
jgi:hypothetical protein